VWRGLPLRLTRTAAVLSTALVLTTCTSDTPFAPRAPIRAQFDVSGLFKAAGQFNISIDRVVVEFRKFSDSSLVLADTIPAGQITQSGDSLRIQVNNIPLESNSEHFYLNVFAYSAGVLYYQVNTDLTVTAGSAPTTTSPLAPSYTGPGFDADSLAFRLDTAIFAGDSVLLTASAYKAGVAVAPAAPVAYDITPLADTLKVPRPRAISTYQAWAHPRAGLTDSVTITAKLPNNLSKTGTLRFAPRVTGPVASLALTPDTQIVQLSGDSARFTPTCRDNTNAVIACGTVNYSSLQPSIATTTPTGYAHAGTTAGAAQIVATAGTAADTAIFIYNGIANIQITPADTVLSSVGDSVILHAASVKFLGGPPTQLPNSQVTWVTLTPVVAQVNNVGRVLAVGPGVATIQATSAGVSGTTTVQVRQKPVSFSVTPKTPVIGIGGVVQLIPKTLDKNGAQIPGRNVTYLTRNATIASVNASGLVTGQGLGTAYVVATDSTGADPVFRDSSLVNVVVAPPSNIQWGADSTSVGRGTTFQQAILLSTPPAGTVTVNIVSSDTNVLKPSQPSVQFFQGQTNTSVSFQGRAAGRVTVTATDPTGLYTPDTLIVGVLSTLEFRTIQSPTIRATNFSINSAEQRSILVFLSDPAPPAGLAVTFQSSTAGIAGVSPATATIPGGQLSAQVDLTGTGVGATSLTPVAAGYVGLPSSVNTFLAQFGFYYFYSQIGAGQYFDNYVTVPNSMDRSLLIHLATKQGIGSTPDTVRMPINNTLQIYRYSALAPGNDTITADAPGWVQGRLPIKVTTPRVRPSYSGNTTAGGPASSWSAFVYDSSTFTSFARSSPLTVTLVSRDPTVMAVTTNTLIIPAGSNGATRSNGLQAVGGGSTYLVATAPGHITDSILVTVQPAKLIGNISYPYQVGVRQTLANWSISLPFQQSAPITVNLTHKATVDSLSATSLVYPAGTTSRAFSITGLSVGTDTIIATATGFQADTIVVPIVNPLVQVYNLGSSYFLTSPPVGFYMCAYTAVCGYNVAADTVPITVTSSNPAKLTVDSSVVHVLPGQALSNLLHLTPVDTGQARLRFSAPAPYNSDSSFVITITGAPITISTGFPQVVGVGQYLSSSVSIPNAAIADVPVALNHTRTVRGTAVPDTVTIPINSSGGSFRWVGNLVGFDSLQATAPGYLPSSVAQMQITRPKLISNGLPASAVTNDTLQLYAYATDSIYAANFYTHPVVDTIFVTMTSSDTTVLKVDSTTVYRILPDQTFIYAPRVITRAPGIARIRLTAANASGSIVYIPDSTGAIVVTAPAITLSPSSFTLGKGQQYRSYSASIPNRVATPTPVALSLSDTTVAGLSSDTVVIAAGSQFSPSFTVFAKSKVASIQLVGTATGFTQGTSVVIVNNPKLSVSAGTSGYVGQAPLSFSVQTTDETGGGREVHDTLPVTFSSTNTAVLTVGTGSVKIPPTGSSAQNTWTPVGPGTAFIVASAPGYPPDTSAAITVQTPPLTLNLQPTLGVGQRYTGSVSIPFARQGTPLEVTLTQTGSALTLPAKDTILVNGFSGSFTVVGAATGNGIVTATATGFVASAPDTTVVGTPILLVNGSSSVALSNQTTTLSITTLDQAQVGRAVNTDLVVTLTVDNPNVADFGGSTTTQVTVLAGSSGSASVTLNLKSLGNLNVTATATGYNNGARPITVQ